HYAGNRASLLRSWKQLRIRRSRSRENHLRRDATKIPDGAPLHKHVPQNAFLHARSASLRQTSRRTPTRQSAHPLGGRRAALRDRKRRRHERLQLHGDPDQATAKLSEISEDEALRFLKEPDTRLEVRNLAFAYFVPEEYPTH